MDGWAIFFLHKYGEKILSQNKSKENSSLRHEKILCCCSVAQSCSTLCDPMDCSTPGFPILHYLWVCSNSCPLSQWCHPIISSSVVLFSSRLQSSPASGSFQMSQFFASGGQSIGFSFSISPSSEYSGLISFRMDCFDLLVVQGTLKNLLQYHSSKSSILQHSAFVIVHLSHSTWLLEKP